MKMNKNLKLFTSYVLPSIISMLVIGSYSIIDSIFIGQYSGKVGLAAVALTWPLVMLLGAIGDLFGSGAAVIISQARGANNKSKAQQIFSNMLFLQIISGVILTGLGVYFLQDILILFGADETLLPISEKYALILIYGCFASIFGIGLCAVIRNDGRPNLAMAITCVSLILNIVLDYVFIFTFSWGLPGAAWATLISQIISCIIGFIYFASPYTSLSFMPANASIKLKNFKEIALNGIPSLGNQLSIIAMLFLHNYQSLRYGGIDGLAVYTFIGAIESLGSLFMTGLSLGVQPLVAFLYGAKKYARQNIIGNMGYCFAFIFGIVLMLVSIFGRHIFPVWFNLHGSVAKLAAHGLVISSTAFLLLGVIRVAGYYYQATGKIKDSSLLIYGDTFFALPLCLFVLPLFYGLDGVWLAMPVSRVILFCFVCFLWLGKKTPHRKLHYIKTKQS